MDTSNDQEWVRSHDQVSELSQDTGPGSHFSNTTKHAPPTMVDPLDSPKVSSKKTAASHVESLLRKDLTSSQLSVPSRSSLVPDNREEAFEDSSRRRNRKRGISLNERYPGDMSHRPLEAIERDHIRAHRSRHLRKAQHSGSDSIDRLDSTSFNSFYHHEGPYEAASLAKNIDPKSAPLAALSVSNAEALKATPKERIIDAVKNHRPLDGTALVPPGIPGPDGKVLRYAEGTDLMRFNGNELRRWQGIDYHPNDLKGKGEPSYTVEKALKPKNLRHRRVVSDHGIYEMKTRQGAHSEMDIAGSGNEASYSQWASGIGRSSSRGKNLVKRFGNLRKSYGRPEDEPLTGKLETRYR